MSQQSSNGFPAVGALSQESIDMPMNYFDGDEAAAMYDVLDGADPMGDSARACTATAQGDLSASSGGVMDMGDKARACTATAQGDLSASSGGVMEERPPCRRLRGKQTVAQYGLGLSSTMSDALLAQEPPTKQCQSTIEVVLPMVDPDSAKSSGAVFTVDGQSFALVGTQVDDIEVHAMQDFKEAQDREVAWWEGFLETCELEDVQRQGRASDALECIVRCPLCPFHSWKVEKKEERCQWRRRMQSHFARRHHCKSLIHGGGWCSASLASTGTKQVHVAKTLFLNDRLIRKVRRTYLADSASILRRHVPDCDNKLDRTFTIVFTRTNIKFFFTS